jgi:hypothetical protein
MESKELTTSSAPLDAILSKAGAFDEDAAERAADNAPDHAGD